MRISDWSSDVCSSDLGQRYGRDGSGSDGETISGSVSHGFALGDGGSFTLSVEGKKANAAVRNTDVTGALYFPLAGGVPDPRELTANRRTYQGGLPDVKDVKVAQTLVLPLGNVTFYSDGTFGYRDARVGQAGRRPNSNQNIIQIYPDGFTRSEEHTSELQSLMRISYAVFCLKKKKDKIKT